MEPKRPCDPRFATTLANGLSLLEAFDAGHSVLTNGQLAQRTGLSRPTVSRLTSTLQARGLIRYDADSRRYQLASGALTIGNPLLASLDIRREARLGMKRLADTLGGSVSLGMRDRVRMVYVETSRGNDPIAFRPDVGAALPMMQTAMGRAWLASAQEDVRCEVLDQLKTQFAPQHARWAGSVERALMEFHERGFCSSSGDWQSDVNAVAVPLQPMFDTERLVVNCGVPAARFGSQALQLEVAPRLLALAREIERLRQPLRPESDAR